MKRELTDKEWCEIKARNLNLPLAVVESALQCSKRHTRKLPIQQPCDIGLFSDEAAQIDLIEMLQEPVNGHD